MLFRGAAAALVIAAVGLIYRESVGSYFFNDDFHWLQAAQAFDPANLLHLERYDHFYRPVIEIYFALGRTVFGCEALPFHILSVAIHLLSTLVLFLFARALTDNLFFAAATAVLFAVQPGYVEAVAWVAAITDLLPALWYLLTLWLHLLFLRSGRSGFYAAALATFSACLLTHESAATLLPMMMALEVTLIAEGRRPPLDSIAGLKSRATFTRATLARAAARYLPFAVLLLGFLALAYVVNSRSYLVRDGYYAFGWHAIPNILNYIVGLYVGERILASYVAIAIVLLWLLVRGTPRVRFFVVWILVTLLPVSFFTWGNASRYLYVPAAGFALLMAEMTLTLEAMTARRMTARRARGVAIALMLVLAGRFAVFATKGSADFRQRTIPYERFAAALKASNSSPAAGATVQVGADDVYGIAEIYIEPAAQVIYCAPDVHVGVNP